MWSLLARTYQALGSGTEPPVSTRQIVEVNDLVAALTAEEFRILKVLVTGAGGFLGSHVVAALLRRGCQVRVLIRPATRIDGLAWADRVDVFRGDLRSSGFPDAGLRRHGRPGPSGGPGGGSDSAQMADTVVGTERLLETMARSATRKLVLASSFSVYGWSDIHGTLTEESPLEADLYRRDGYAIAKTWQERLVRRFSQEHNWDLTVLRPGFIWGRDHEYLACLGQKLGSWHLVFGPSTRLPLTYVENCADCFAQAVENPRAAGETFNIVDDHEVSAWRYLGEYIRLTRSSRAPHPGPVRVGDRDLASGRLGSTDGSSGARSSFPVFWFRAGFSPDSNRCNSAPASCETGWDGTHRSISHNAFNVPMKFPARFPNPRRPPNTTLPSSTMSERLTIGYLTSFYARAGDTYIRREVEQLRRMGHVVHTFSIRKADPSELVSEAIRQEHAQTEYIFEAGLRKLAWSGLRTAIAAPRKFLNAAKLVLRHVPPGIKHRWIRQISYLLEAAYLAERLKAKDVQHLHNHIGESSAMVAMLAAMLQGIPYSLTIHGPERVRSADACSHWMRRPGARPSWSRSASSPAASSIGGSTTAIGPRSTSSTSGSARCTWNTARTPIALGPQAGQYRPDCRAEGPGDLDPGGGSSARSRPRLRAGHRGRRPDAQRDRTAHRPVRPADARSGSPVSWATRG